MKKFGLLFFLIYSAPAAWAVPNFTNSNVVLVSSALPQAVDTSTVPMRLYFLRENQIFSSTSTDGYTWSQEAGVRLSTNSTPQLNVTSITACSLLTLTGGGYRMLFSIQVGTSIWNVQSATSSDGLAWAAETSTRIAASNGTFLSTPRLVKLPGGNWRVYYLQDTNGGNQDADRRALTSVSSDEGQTWGSASLVVNEQIGTMGTFVRTDQRIRLYMTQALSGETTNSTIISAISSDSNGTSFDVESGTRLSTDSTRGSLSFPVVYRSSETFRHRLLYAFTVEGSTIPQTFTGLTTAPDATGMSPEEVNRTDPNGTFTISGEIFGSTPTVLLRQTGQSDIPGTSVAWTDDQTLTAVFATNAQALGAWDLVVTNPDGVSDTVSSALNITFQSGQVSLLDNLLRLSSNGSTQISVTIYNEGHIKAQLFTLDGKLVNVLYDGEGVLGTTVFTWNGRTAENNPVASGTYVLKVEGPKLDDTQKIVVIR